MSYKPIDTRRDEFRKYLERTGVMDCLTKTLAKLLNANENGKPDDAIEFIRMNLGDNLNDKNTIQSLRQDLEESQKTIEELKKKLSAYEAGAGDPGALNLTAKDDSVSLEPNASLDATIPSEWTGQEQQEATPAKVESESQPVKAEGEAKPEENSKEEKTAAVTEEKKEEPAKEEVAAAEN